MIERHVDILVVGAGPAGAAAARAAAQSGAVVLMVERRKTVGVPVQCAEFIPAPLLGEIDLGKDFVVQAVKGMKTFREGGPETFTRAPGYMVHRDRLDQALVQAAVAAGAELMTGTRVTEQQISGAVILKQKRGSSIRIQPWIVIGADGPHSTVAGWVTATDIHRLPGVQMTCRLTEALDHTEIYLHPDFRAGYGWLFPKGEMANVGLGFKTNNGDDSTLRIRKALDRFVLGLKAQGRITGEPQGCAAGWIPTRARGQTVFDRIVLVGDAAGHTHPITGAGIFSAVVSGRMAGQWAGRAVRKQDPGLLLGYEEEWRDLMGDTLRRASQRRQEMEAGWEDFSETIQRCWIAYRGYYA